MQRRRYIAACLGTTAAAGLAGCAALGIETREIRSTPPVLEQRPDAVYFPTHVDGMKMVGKGEAETGSYAVALTYTHPHRFWRVDATTASVADATVEEAAGHDVHLMALVWDPETKRTLPNAGVTVDIERDGEPLDEQVIYPMLSARMGFHYGANFSLDGDGTYDVTVSVGGTSIRQTGAYRGRFGDPASVTLPFEYSAAARDEISVEETPDRAGDRDAPSVMGMDMPLGVARTVESLPGEHRGTAESGDAQLEVLTLESPPAGIDGEGAYLAISARTPYNRLVLPAMALEARLERDGEVVYEGPLRRTFDDGLGYHYGAVVESVAEGDSLAVEVRTHPQVARHEGFETAFLSMPAAELTL